MKTFPNELLELVLKDVCEIDDEVFEFAYEFNPRPQTAVILTPKGTIVNVHRIPLFK